ncbi:phosphatase PAP2 family protein [Vibrio marisflavi]|nr:phosphatase PAP2 family protein [Vibrio marisflavi]
MLLVRIYRKHLPAIKLFVPLLCAFFSLVIVLTFSNVLRFTPIHTIDLTLYKLDLMLGIDQNQIMNWVFSHKYLVLVLRLAYASLGFQVIFLTLPIFIFFSQKSSESFLAKLALVNLLGLTIYYFFPTASPASVLSHQHLVSGQINLALAFKQIHQGIIPSDLGDGLISFPSFHIIWSTLYTYTFRTKRWVFYPLLVLNAILACSTFLLGWHYFVDIVGGWFVMAVAIFVVDVYPKLSYKNNKQKTQTCNA